MSQVKVPMISHQWSENLPPSAAPALLSGVDQLQMVERLRQLRAWQVQQQGNLLRRQQEELAKLKSEQRRAATEGLASPVTVCQPANITALKSIENIPVSDSPTPPKPSHGDSQGPSPDSGGIHPGDGPVLEGRALVRPTPASDESPLTADGEEENRDEDGGRLAQNLEDDRPIQSAIRSQPGWSFEQILESQLAQAAPPPPVPPPHRSVKRPFLRKGQGSARFGMMKPTGPKTRRTQDNKRAVEHPEGASLPPTSPEFPHRKRTGNESPHLGDNREALFDSNESLSQGPLRVSTPTLRRCSSEDSFLVRKDHRLQLEEEELMEFELLELAAQNSSLSSPSPLPPEPCATPTSDPPLNPPASWTTGAEEGVAEAPPTAEAPRTVDEPGSDSEVDLDETLKASKAADMQFSDEEPWESFVQGSPQSHGPSPSKDNHTHLPPTWVPHVRREVLDQGGEVIHTSPVPAPSFMHPPLADPTLSAPQPARPALSHLPPPSALVSKLFPALRKEREDARRQTRGSLVGPTSLPGLQSSSSASLQSSEGSGCGTESSHHSMGDSGRGSVVSPPPMGDELRQKLCELETEIERFQAENTALGKLRENKEKELLYLKEEVAEFERQKQEEIERFEDYKKEEIKKLKRERKVFESYQRESRAAKDKKDKEEIEMLRSELQGLREELQRRESRWSATMARHKQRVESLEARNREVEGDLKVMEEERLQWWQAQLETCKKSNPRKGGGATAGKLSTDAHKSVTRSKPKRTSAPTRQSTETAKPQVSKGPESVTGGGEPVAKQKDEESDESECEIVDIVCQEVEDGDNESDLSTAAEDIVNKVLGTPCTEGGERREADLGDRGAEGRKATKSVRFSELPPGGGETTSPALQPVQREAQLSKEKVESVQADGSKVIKFPNGTRKTVSRDGRTTSVHFFNGDIKRIQPNHTVVYYYADSRTTHTAFPDGLEVLEFPNNQSEKHYPNGTKEISFPDGTTKFVYVGGEEESVFADGTVQKLLPNGERSIEFPSGQREVHTKAFKRREYPDGTVKTVYPDGRQETHYASGRLRIKNKTGNVLVDKMEQKNHTT